jgi:predicted RNA-binding Zn ribbon-like protein
MATKDPTAPGALERVRRFVNTMNVDEPDQLAAPETAARWLRENGLLEGSGAFDEAAAAHLRGFREAVREALLAHAGDGDAQTAWDGVRALAQNVPLRMRFGPAPGDAHLDPAGAGAQEALGRLVAAIYDASLAGTWSRLKACRQQSCLWAFYDHSKNSSGVWCSMAVCGNRAKARRRRQRLATKEAPTEL